MTAQSILTRTQPTAVSQPALDASPLAKLVSASSRFAPSVRRLVILIPDADTEETELAREIWAMAVRRELVVLLLGICSDVTGEARSRRRLATIASLARDKQVQVEMKLYPGDDWVQAVRKVHRYSDLVICQAEQQVALWGVQRQPLSQWLTTQLNEPVAMLEGFYPHIPPDFVNPAWRLLATIIPFVIFLGFTALQVLIHQLAQGSGYVPLLAFSVIVEYGLIGLWNYFFN